MDEQTLFPLEALPPELRSNILLLLDHNSLLAACRVSKSWMRVISCVPEVWFAACKGLGLLLADDVQWVMCRDVYLRLVQRWRSVIKHYSFVTKCFYGYYDDCITAVYYHDGKIVTGFQSGAMSLMDCATNSWVWANICSSYSVTCIKFDDRILLASHCNGTVMSRDIRTGDPIRKYPNPCLSTCTVDYLSEANLVFSSERKLVAWDMTSGRLVLAETLNELRASTMLVAPYPGEAKKLLVVVHADNSLVLWQATSWQDSFGQLAVSVRITNVIRVNCPNGRTCFFPIFDLHFDGQLLYFVTHELRTCRGYLNQWDVGERCLAGANSFNYPVKKLIGVGKKYVLVIAETGEGQQQMNILEKISFKPVTRIQLCRKYLPFQNDVFCIGRRSWLDGFDGSNDQGEVLFYVCQPTCVNYLVWHDRRATGYTLPCGSGINGI